MAKLTGPLMSLSASGSIGKTLTYGAWKGINWVREHFIPANPQSTTQTNVRLAFQFCVEEWTDTITQQQKDAYAVGAAGQGYSGFNLWQRRAMNGYVADVTPAVTPTGVSVAGDYPSDVITWTP